MKILFLVPHPAGVSPSQRFRVEQYSSVMTAHGISYRVDGFFSARSWKHWQSKNLFKNIFSLVSGYASRFLSLFRVSSFDFIFIHREAAPLGPPVFEWVIAKILRRKIIYDFDDAIWLTDKTSESNLERFFRSRWKVRKICRWAYKVSCGNDYLGSYARQFNSNVIFCPTTFDEHYHRNLFRPKETKDKDQVIIGWTGSHSTIKYLEPLIPIIQTLEREFPFVSLLIIADKDPGFQLDRIQFVSWQLATEIDDLQQIDIGVMPLPVDDWTKGKCGFKAIQYMALEIPAVVSSIGANEKIIDHSINGFLCHSESDWIAYLSQLISNPGLRNQLGKQARKKVIQYYSVSSNAEVFLALFS